MKVESIRIYPVKSLAGGSAPHAQVEPWGLRDDRRWVVLDPAGTVITAREDHRLLGVTAEATPDGITLTSRDGEQHLVATPSEGESVPTSTSRLESVRVADDGANGWLSDVLGRPVRLGWLDDPRRRSVSEAHGGAIGDPLTLADAGPLLVTSTTSLAQLNDWIDGEKMEMLRFRPNVVIDGPPVPFEEDQWRIIRIGGVSFRFAEICDRCVMTTLDPHTLKGGKEPLRTLARYRQWDHKTWFGVRVIPTSPGKISLGDEVEVLSRA